MPYFGNFSRAAWPMRHASRSSAISYIDNTHALFVFTISFYFMKDFGHCFGESKKKIQVSGHHHQFLSLNAKF